MPITILDYVKSVAGKKDFYTARDFASAGVAMLGGCERCNATLGAYNAYPTQSGYWRCNNCLNGSGFASVEEFASSPVMACPACGNVTGISETADSLFECGECGAQWAL